MNLNITPKINISESAAHIAVSGIVCVIRKVTIKYCPIATIVAVMKPAITAPLIPPVELTNTHEVVEWKNRIMIVGKNK